MFGIFASADRKMRQNAVQWLELAEKVRHYRRDVLTGDELNELQAHATDLRRLVREKAERMKLKLAIESLEEVLRRLGGTHYPKSSLVENIEFFLVAAIVILGFRTYFIQPFKIPTNSMWPSYYGMKADVFPLDQAAPGPVNRVFRLLAFGAQRRTMVAPHDGQVSADFTEGGALAYTVKRGRDWLILPATVKEYTFYVDGDPVKVTVPLDFHDFDEAMWQSYFGGEEQFVAYIQNLFRTQGRSLERSVILADQISGTKRRVVRVPLNRTVHAGDPVMQFDILTGDQLFVDRMSYNFVRPKVGQGFVFRTGKIDSIYMKNPHQENGKQIDQYYIKRLVGLPGDTLEIKDYTLYRNGQPITGAAAFAKNAKREDHYVGYRNEMSLGIGETMTVPPNHFLALGDNSANSEDGRYWGYVPATEAVGRPLFIYYPFTRRWGPAH